MGPFVIPKYNEKGHKNGHTEENKDELIRQTGAGNMTDKELRKLKRTDLLELLIEQSKEVESLKKRIEELEAELADRRLLIYKSGSIAEAALKLNGVFEAAEAAAQEYLENIRRISEEKTQEAAGASGDGR